MGMKKKSSGETAVVLQDCERCGSKVPVLFLSKKDGKKVCSRCLQLENPDGEGR